MYAALGARGTSAAPTEDDPFERPPVQRTVSAAGAPPLALNPDSNPFTSWRRPGSPAPIVDTDEEPAAANDNDEESSTVAREPTQKKPRKPRAAKPTSPQFQLCALLLDGDRTREELLADVSANRNAFNQAIFNAKASGRVEFLEKSGKYHLTKVGREWVTGGATAAPAPARKAKPRAAAKKVRAAKPHKVAAAAPTAQAPSSTGVTVLDTSPQVLTPPSFRCAVISDGGFWLTKNGVEIELTLDEHRQMVRYQERMGVDA